MAGVSGWHVEFVYEWRRTVHFGGHPLMLPDCWLRYSHALRISVPGASFQIKHGPQETMGP